MEYNAAVFNNTMDMLSVQEALEIILQAIQPVGETRVKLELASQRVLTRDIHAPVDLPLFDNSAMDGFAVRSSDTSTTPVTLRVVDDIPAGADVTNGSIKIAPGEAARIMTGAPIPEGADAVIPVEETDFNNHTPGSQIPPYVTLSRSIKPAENIRSRGSDILLGQIILKRHTQLRPQEIGLLAMLGQAEIPVFEVPTIALLSSGDELQPVGVPLPRGKIHDSNTPMLAAQINELGANIVQLGIANDDRQSVKTLLDQAVAGSVDLIISSAGVSVGAFDFIKEVVESSGSLNFWRVNMRPGKPLVFGKYRGIPFIGLPGNPVSAFVTFEVFVRPAIEKLAGREPLPRRRIIVKLAEAIESDGRESYLRAVVSGNGWARLTGHQGSGNLRSLVDANALLIIPAGVKSRPAGQEVEAWLI